MNIWEKQEKEWQVKQHLEKISDRQRECDDLEKELNVMEEDMYWQNRQIKEVNDDLFSTYPQDAELQSLLVEKEEMLQQKMSMEKLFMEDCRDSIKDQRAKSEAMKEICETELLLLHKEEGETPNEDNLYTDAD